MFGIGAAKITTPANAIADIAVAGGAPAFAKGLGLLSAADNATATALKQAPKEFLGYTGYSDDFLGRVSSAQISLGHVSFPGDVGAGSIASARAGLREVSDAVGVNGDVSPQTRTKVISLLNGVSGSINDARAAATTALDDYHEVFRRFAEKQQ